MGRTVSHQGFMTGELLVAMPRMRDARFTRSVIYVCAHTGDGAMGLVVNRLAARPRRRRADLRRCAQRQMGALAEQDRRRLHLPHRRRRPRVIERVMAGLDPAISLQCTTAEDARVKPAHDDHWGTHGYG